MERVPFPCTVWAVMEMLPPLISIRSLLSPATPGMRLIQEPAVEMLTLSATLTVVGSVATVA